MKIFSNAFPTNMPDAEQVSQGGPANFAKLFTNYIVDHTGHSWCGLLFEASSKNKPHLKKFRSFLQRDYYRLEIPKNDLKAITRAKHTVQPERQMAEVINLITKLITVKNPDVIFLNGFGIFNWLLLKAGEKAGVPVVIQHAGIWTKELYLHRKNYSRAGRRMLEEMERDSSRLTHHEIFLNLWSRKYYNDNVFLIRKNHSSIVPLPFDFSSFQNVTSETGDNLFSFDPKRTHVGIIARWDDIKNHKAVMRLAEEARRKNVAWDFHAVVQIPDNSQQKNFIERYKRNVDVIPPIDRGGIRQFCQAVDILIQPSLFDVSPTVVLEAFGSGTPIVISPEVGFVGEFKACGGASWVVNFDDPMAALSVIGKNIGKKMPSKLVRMLKKNHASKKVFEKYLEIFEKCSAFK